MKLFDSNSSAPRATRDARLTAINFVADAINRTIDLHEIADNALHAMLAVTGVDAGAVYVWAEDEKALRLFAHRGVSESFARQVSRLPKGDDATIDEVLEGAIKVIEDFTLTPKMFRMDMVRAGFRSGVLCPIRAQGFVVGMLALGMYKERAFETEDVDLIEVISNQIGNAMVHAHLEADLRASEEQYRGLVENSDDAIYIAGPDVRPRYANTAFPRILGFRADELAALDPYERIHPDDVESVRAAVNKLMDGQSVHNLEYRFCRKDGQWIDLQCNASVFARDGEQVEEFQFVVREVTQIRQRQQQLVRRNLQLGALTTLAAVANSSLNIEEIARNTLQVAIDSAGMEGGSIHLADNERKRLKLFIHAGLPGDLVQELNDLAWGEGTSGAVAASGQAKVYTDIAAEAPMARPASIRHGFRSLIVVPIKVKGETLGTLGLISHKEVQFGAEVVEMVTAMGNQLGIALSNARLFVDISRKNELLELLIEEAHHRIKNNLQMISGLLQLEADDAPTPGLRTAITRIQAIAQVHNLLSSEMPEKVDTHSLITTIVHMLTGTAPTYSGPPEMELDIEHLWLNADQAVALALIVNELTSNSLLHGQPPAGERLRLRVQCRQTDNEVCVIVSDNGGGLPADVDWRMSTGQGMSIVHQLAQINLRGSLVTGNRDGGLHAELRFTNAAPLTPRQPEP